MMVECEALPHDTLRAINAAVADNAAEAVGMPVIAETIQVSELLSWCRSGVPLIV